MLDEKEINMLFPDQSISHVQKMDFTPSSYFIDTNIFENASKKRNFLNLEGKNQSGVSSVICGNNKYFYKNNVAVGRHSELESSNQMAFSNLLQANFQQKESLFSLETFTNENANMLDIEQNICTTQVESSNLEEQISPITDDNNQFFMEKTCMSSSLSSERPTEIGDGVYANIDKQISPTNRTVSPIISENIWDGPIKFNASTTVPAIFFFKSGEKVQDLKWPDQVEIKGKVRMNAFEKFIQELPRSRNRALMVISLCWKSESCRTGLAALMEIARGYKESEKVGFAKIFPGIDLYVCPHSDIIIAILAKYGFYKGAEAAEENQDSLIGCIVWRKNQLSVNTAPMVIEEKKNLTQEQSLDSTGLSIKKMNSPVMEECEFEKKQAIPSEKKHKTAMEAVTLTDTISMITENKSAPLSSNSVYASMTSSIPYNFPLVPDQQIISERPFLSMIPEKMKPKDTIPIALGSSTDEAVMISDSWTQFVSPSQMSPEFKLGNFAPPGPRPLIPIDSSNFQFRPQVAQNTDFSVANNFVPSFQATQHVLPGPPPLPFELLHMLSQSNKNVAKDIDGGILQNKIHIMNHMVASGSANILDKRKFFDGYYINEKNDNDNDDDDLPEFDFPAAFGEPEAPMNRFPGCFPNAPQINRKISFKASSSRVGNPAPLATSRESFQALQHSPKPSSFPKKLQNSNEGLTLAKNLDSTIFEKFSYTEGRRPIHHSSCSKKVEEIRNDPRQDFGFKHKSLWDDDNDDMPEWCPPDLDLPEDPVPNTRLSEKPFHQMSQPGLLGSPPIFEATTSRPAQTRPAGKFSKFSRSPNPPFEPRHKDSVRPHINEFNRRPPSYAADRRPHRR